MKIKLTICILILCKLLIAQTPMDKLVAQLQTNYNNKNYRAIYNQLSSEAKNGMPEKDLINFFSTNLAPAFGKFLSFKIIKSTENRFLYTGYFEGDSLQLNCTLSKSNLFDDFSFTPFPPIVLPKRSNYLSDNKRISILDTTIDKLVKPYMENSKNCGLSIAIIKNDSVFYYNYGETKKDNKQLPNNKTIYEIGSITKTFCGRLLAIAVLENKISLEDDIRKYIKGTYPNLEYKGTPILIKHLANHTSGLVRVPDNLQTQSNFDMKNPYKYYSNKDLLESISSSTLSVIPGTNCEYSNLGMGLLGYILETVYNKSFSELVKEKITSKIGMTNTDITNTKLNQLITGYNDAGQATPNWEFNALQAAGALCSNSEEMALYAKENLKQNAINNLTHNPTFNNGNKVALAWHFIKRKTDSEMIWHNGGTGGFASFIGLIKEKNCAFVVLTNSSPQTDALPLSIYNYLKK